MGKWLAALKKYKNGESVNTQNPQPPPDIKIGAGNDNKKNAKTPLNGTDKTDKTPNSIKLTTGNDDGQKHKKNIKIPENGTDKTDKTIKKEVLSVLSVRKTPENEFFLNDEEKDAAPQNLIEGGFVSFVSTEKTQKQNFFLNNTPHDDGDFSSAGMLTNVDIAESKFSPQTITPDHKPDMQMLTNVNLLTGTPSAKTGYANKPRTLKIVESYNGKARPDDAEVYARALELHGAMSYGMAMQILEWGATRAANAQDQLREAGRIEFNKYGRAVLVKDC